MHGLHGTNSISAIPPKGWPEVRPQIFAQAVLTRRAVKIDIVGDHVTNQQDVFIPCTTVGELRRKVRAKLAPHERLPKEEMQVIVFSGDDEDDPLADSGVISAETVGPLQVRVHIPKMVRVPVNLQPLTITSTWYNLFAELMNRKDREERTINILLYGAAGAGKSSFVNLVSTMFSPTTGMAPDVAKALNSVDHATTRGPTMYFFEPINVRLIDTWGFKDDNWPVAPAGDAAPAAQAPGRRGPPVYLRMLERTIDGATEVPRSRPKCRVLTIIAGLGCQ
jgi:hypothetical protein